MPASANPGAGGAGVGRGVPDVAGNAGGSAGYKVALNGKDEGAKSCAERGTGIVVSTSKKAQS